MKNLYTLVAVILLTASIFAQAPEKMSYQAIIRDSGDALVANQAIGMQISVLQGSAVGTAVYIETQSPTTNINGLVSLEIGNGMIVSGAFSAIDWSAGPYFIKTETDPTGGSSYTITGTSQLLSVPYAIYSKIAKNGLPSGGTEGQVLTINSSGIAEWTAASSGSIFYADTDGDGYGDFNSTVIANVAPNGYVINSTDCDDADNAINPIGTEICDGIDNDCDGLIDDADPNVTGQITLYADADADGFGDPNTSQLACSQQIGYVSNNTDCNDMDNTINPGQIEIYGDGIDNNCNGETDETEIGQFIFGGVVFWIDPADNTHGLVCAIVDQSAGIQWFNGSYITTGAIGSGSANTDAIITAQGDLETNYAAGLASAYSGGDYTDWFLPSSYELYRIYLNKATIDVTATANGGVNIPYSLWSSTEYDIGNAEVYSDTGYAHIDKSFTRPVRAVRAF